MESEKKEFCPDCNTERIFYEDRALPSKNDVNRILTWLSCESCGHQRESMREATDNELEYFNTKTIDYKIKSRLRKKKISITCPICNSKNLKAPDKLFTMKEDDQFVNSEMYGEDEPLSFVCLICQNCQYVIWYAYHEINLDDEDDF